MKKPLAKQLSAFDRGLRDRLDNPKAINPYVDPVERKRWDEGFALSVYDAMMMLLYREQQTREDTPFETDAEEPL
jgi:hypothetical protein